MTRPQVQERPYIVPPKRPDTDDEHRGKGRHDQDVVPPRPDHESHGSTRRLMMRPMRTVSILASLLVFVATVGVADAAPKKKYHFELAGVLLKPEVKADVAKIAKERVEGIVKKAFATHPQLVADLEGAPDKGNADAYRKYLAKKGIAGAYLVTVEITEATEEVVPMEGKANAQRVVVHVGLHVLGETIPGRTMGFTGDGQATIKQEVGMKVRQRDRDYTWDSAAETAVGDAMKTAFDQLAKPMRKQ
jgi:hypothetical protein